MMDRRAFLAIVTSALAAPLAAEAQRRHPARVGVLWYFAVPWRPSPLALALADLGYTDGKNIRLLDRDVLRNVEHVREQAADLLASGVDVLVAVGSVATRGAIDVTRTIPIVMVGTDIEDPVALQLVTSVRRPGGNVTGVVAGLPGINAKRLELLGDAAGRLSRVAVLVNSGNPAHAPAVSELRAAADNLKVEVRPFGIQDYGDLVPVFEPMARWRAQGLLVLQDGIFRVGRGRIVEGVEKLRLPAIYPAGRYVDRGGLMSYGPDLSALYRQGGVYVDRILKGAEAGELPVEQPARFELIVNLKTAKALGLIIPPSLLLRADQVIE